jgi:hypothetical protein
MIKSRYPYKQGAFMADVRNIGPKGCKRRMRIGTGILIFSAIYLAVLMITRAPAILWIGVLISTFVGLVCLLQAVEKTCIILAAQGVIMVDDLSKVPVVEPVLSKKLKNKSVRLMVKAVLLTSLLFIFYFLVPKN